LQIKQFRALFGDGHQGHGIAAVANLIFKLDISNLHGLCKGLDFDMLSAGTIVGRSILRAAQAARAEEKASRE
jgi:hypothetical protein